MAGYSRQSAADIIASAIIRAAPVNAEYNAIRDAFAFATGHKHDGSSTEGAYIPLIADTDAKNKVVVDTTNNRISVYSEVGGAAVEQLRIQDGAIVPVTDDDIDLGASGAEFKDLYIDGIGYIDTLAVHENATIAGTLNVTGVITAPGGLVADITGDITGNVTGDLTGDVTSTGTSTFSDLDAVDLSATGTTVITSGDINSGTIDNSVIGAATPAAGTFTTIDANTSLTAATADINGGTIDGATIGATSHTTGKFTTLQSTGQATLNTVDINGGNIDGTVIGAVGTAAGSFTTLSTSGQATLATVNIDGGAIDGTTIGASSAATGAFTTVSASGGVTGDVTGNLTGNVTGNVTGDITGDVTGDLTGNVTSTGSSSFNNVTIDGTLNMNAGTTATITNLTSPTNTNDAATKGYVDTQVSNLVDSAPGTLDTLNELAAALGDDPDFATTVTNSIATKLPLAGGTMTGAIAMSTNKITGAGDPTAAQDVATKAYVDTQDGLQVTKSGDTMSGNLAMGSNKVTGLAAPTDANDATTKTYVDAILGSGSDAAASAAAAATSEANAATSETNASNSASAAATSEANAAASYDNFDDRYLGAKSTAPTVDNDGDALIVGALYFNNTTNIMYVYSSGGWQAAGSSVNGTSDRNTYTATSGQTVFAATYDTGYVDVYLNGVKLISGTDFTATNGTSITLTTGAAVNDVVDIVAYGTFVLADHYTSSQSDARYVEVAGDTMTGNLNVTGTITSDGADVSGGADSTGQVVLSQGNATSKVSRIIGTNQGGTNERGIDFNTYYYADFKRMNISPTGDISFYEDTGTTPKFFWDASAESLGIGVTDPDSALEVQSSASGLNSVHLSNTSSTGYGAKFIGGGNTSTRYIADFRDYSGASKLRLDGDGNVGIGTSSPSSLLDVDKSQNSETNIEITNTNTGSAAQVRTKYTTDGGLFTVGKTSNAHAYGGDAYVHNVDNTNIRFATSDTERMRIDSSGHLLVGTTAQEPSASNDDSGFSVRPVGTVSMSRTSGPTIDLNRKTSDGDIAVFRKDGSAVGSIGTAAYLYIGSAVDSDTFIKFADSKIRPSTSAGANRDNAIDLGASNARFKDLYLSGGVIQSDGGESVFGGGSPVDSVVAVSIQGASNADAAEVKVRTNGKNAFKFRNSSNSTAGSITVNASSTAYNTSSDYRLKENVVYEWDATTRLKQLKPARFNFIADADTTVDGFIAHEVQAVVPEAITGTKDAMRDEEYEVTPAVTDNDGNVVTEAVMGTRSVPDYQGIDQSKLVPLLTAALQEALTKIDDMEARLAALEA